MARVRQLALEIAEEPKDPQAKFKSHLKSEIRAIHISIAEGENVGKDMSFEKDLVKSYESFLNRGSGRHNKQQGNKSRKKVGPV